MLNILYITTAEITYPRNENLLYSLKDFAKVEVISPILKNNQGAHSRVKYFISTLIVLIKALFILIFYRKKYDLVFIGFLAQPIVPFIRIVWKKKLIVDMFVSLYDTVCLDKVLVKPNSILGRFTLILDKLTLSYPDILITDTNCHLEYFTTLKRCDFQIRTRILIGAKEHNYKVANDINTSFFTVIFVGAFIPLQGATYIVEAAKILDDTYFKFILIGDGQERKSCELLLKDYRKDNIVFTGRLNFKDSIEKILKADIILGIFGNSNKAQRVIPNKVYDATYLGKPVITINTPAIREIFVPDFDFIQCKPADPINLAEKIRWCFQNKNKIFEIGKNGQITYKNRCNRDLITKDLKNLTNFSNDTMQKA
jgi:glycosyltransferase involved in cell wall biosynthesis